jgi:hypothetical protein
VAQITDHGAGLVGAAACHGGVPHSRASSRHIRNVLFGTAMVLVGRTCSHMLCAAIVEERTGLGGRVETSFLGKMRVRLSLSMGMVAGTAPLLDLLPIISLPIVIMRRRRLC